MNGFLEAAGDQVVFPPSFSKVVVALAKSDQEVVRVAILRALSVVSSQLIQQKTVAKDKSEQISSLFTQLASISSSSKGPDAIISFRTLLTLASSSHFSAALKKPITDLWKLLKADSTWFKAAFISTKLSEQEQIAWFDTLITLLLSFQSEITKNASV